MKRYRKTVVFTITLIASFYLGWFTSEKWYVAHEHDFFNNQFTAHSRWSIGGFDFAIYQRDHFSNTEELRIIRTLPTEHGIADFRILAGTPLSRENPYKGYRASTLRQIVYRVFWVGSPWKESLSDRDIHRLLALGRINTGLKTAENYKLLTE